MLMLRLKNRGRYFLQGRLESASLSGPIQQASIGLSDQLSSMSMRFLRCLGFMLVVFLGACDAKESPLPVPKVATEVKAAVQVAPTPAPDAVPVHELMPSVPVVPVVIAQNKPASVKAPVTSKPVATTGSPAKTSATKAAATKATDNKKTKPESTPVKSRAPIANKTKPAAKVVQDTRLSKPNLDLSLPQTMADELEPVGTVAPIANKSILPPMFSEKKNAPNSPFQLNGRLLSNEMKLQMREENRREVEGAALDFEFRQ